MKWRNRYWYEFGLIPAVIALVILIIGWKNLIILLRVGLINFIGIMLHQFEEYGYPSGTPYFMNKYMNNGDERYPLNQLSAMIGNLLIVYLCYLFSVFLPDVI